MPFDSTYKEYINNYCTNHLPTDSWFDSEFDFIANNELKSRVITEFKNVRFMYKLFEGLEVTEDLLLAEVRTQMLMYATIYEAIIHYVLFECYPDHIYVKELLMHTIPKQISIPSTKLTQLKTALQHNGKDIFTFYYDTCCKPITAVRFDEKCYTAQKLGLIKNITLPSSTEIKLVDELIKIYEIRNGIHFDYSCRFGTSIL